MKGQMLLCLQKERLKESKNIKTKTKQAKNNSKLNKQTKKRIFFSKKLRHLTFQNTVSQCSLQMSHPHHTSKQGEEGECTKVCTLEPQSYRKGKASWRGYLRANALRCHSQTAPTVTERKADTEQLNCQNAQVVAFFFKTKVCTLNSFFPPVFSLFFCGDWRSDLLSTFNMLLISANKFYKQTKVTQNPKTIYIKHVVFT